MRWRPVVTALGAQTSLAHAQSSASFKVQGGGVDTAGGLATSASHVVTACVGSEIAGSQSSASYRIDSGCGAVALFVPTPAAAPGDSVPIPAMSPGGIAALAIALLVAAALATRRSRSV